MLNSELGLTPTSPHSLPWYPPTCDEEQLAKIKLPAKYANLPGFGTSVTKDKVPDENARPRFLVSFGKVDMTENLAELGARIKTVQEAGTWPPWLLHLLAGTYWRIMGNTGTSLTCHGLALAEVPVTFRDLVLTNLGSLLYKLGHIDESLRLVKEALAICDTEPETHFFLGNLLAAKGNMTGSIEHYRAALRLEPDFPGGVAQLRIPSCYVKYHLGPGPGAAGDGETHIFAEKDQEPQHCHAPGSQGGPGCNKVRGQNQSLSVSHLIYLYRRYSSLNVSLGLSAARPPGSLAAGLADAMTRPRGHQGVSLGPRGRSVTRVICRRRLSLHMRSMFHLA